MANPTGSGRTQADKQRSKQMSRSVTANPPSGKGAPPPDGRGAGAAGGPRRSAQRQGGSSGRPPGRGGPPPKRTGGRPSPSRPSRRSPTALLTWGTAALVVVIVVVLVVVKVSGGGNSPQSGPPATPTSPTVAAQVTGVAASVFNQVGTTTSVSNVNPPTPISGQPALTYTDSDGKVKPGVYYYGAEYCPYCAAARWSLIAALSRFGTFHGLYNMQSSATDVYPNTPTFTFAKATYTSPYIVFKSDEYLSNQVNAAGSGYTVLQRPGPKEAKLVVTYDTAKYFPSLSAGQNGFPFIDFANKIIQDSVFDPGLLSGLTREQIAAGLSDAKNPISQIIVVGANYLSASVCAIDGQQPASVCTSPGVTAAAKALKLG